MFQHMIKTPMAMPMMAALMELTFPRYSGARNSASAPKLFIKLLFTMLNMMIQKASNTWYFLK